MIRPKIENYIEFEDDDQYKKYIDYIHDLERYCDELEYGNHKEFKGKKLVTKERYKNALSSLYDLVNIENKDKDFILENGQILEDSCAILQQLIDLYFNNTADFKHFKLYSDSYLQSSKFKKGDLISYIHMLYHNWQACDGWCENLIKANHELSNKTDVLLKANNDKESTEYPEVNREKIYKELEEYSRGWHINKKDLIPWDDVIKVVDRLIDDNNKMIANYTEEMAMRKSLESKLFNMTRPLKFEDLKENMWVFDSYLKCAIYITKIKSKHIKSKFEHSNDPIEDEIFCILSGGDENSNCFEENRFYPIIIPKVMDE